MQLYRLPDTAQCLLSIAPTEIPIPGVSALETPIGKVWIKTVEPPSHRFRRVALAILGRVLPFPVLRPSKVGKGGNTLLLQADQIRKLSAVGLPVPTVHYCDQDVLILDDAGTSLEAAVKYSDVRARSGVSEQDLHSALHAMTDTLIALHRKGFAHGRPKIRDFAWRDGDVTLLDLEERPWDVMPMPAAQARDVFLWIVDLCSYPLSRKVASSAFARILAAMNEDTARETRQIVRLLALAAPPVRAIGKLVPKNREIRGSLAAYDIMKAEISIRLEVPEGQKLSHDDRHRGARF